MPGKSSNPDDKEDDGFDADVAIATGELRRLLSDLSDALGGPLAQAPAESAAPIASDTPGGSAALVASDAPSVERMAA